MFVTLNQRETPPAVLGMSNNILGKYREVAFVDAEWTGDANLRLNGKFDAHSIHEQPSSAQTYECLSNEMKLNSRGFRQTTKGRSLGRRIPNQIHSINPLNAFNYSLPITSRTVVNQVNYSYSVLERVTGEDATRSIRVRLRDCVVVGNSITANVPLDRVWERIERVRVEIGNISRTTASNQLTILPHSATNILRLQFSADLGTANNFTVEINY